MSRDFDTILAEASAQGWAPEQFCLPAPSVKTDERAGLRALQRNVRLTNLAAAHLMRQSLADPSGARDYDAAFRWAESELTRRDSNG
jgi:hypothetical protein